VAGVLLASFLPILSAPAQAAVSTTGAAGKAMIYGVLADRRLTFTVIDTATNGRTHVVVSTGTLAFAPKAMATLNFNTVLITSTAGALYRVDIITNSSSLVFSAPVNIGSGWTHDLLAFDGHGHLFGIADGALRRYNLLDTKPGAGSITGNTLIDTGFTLKTLTATGNNWIVGTTSGGALLSYSIRGANDWTRYELRSSTWQVFSHLLSPGGGIYLGRRTEGSMFGYFDANAFNGSGTDITGLGAVDTSGWTQTMLSAQPATAAKVPPRTDGLTKPVYFVHGYSDDGDGFNARGSYWNEAIAAFTNTTSPARLTGPVWTWCFYGNDTNCDLQTPGDRNVPIKELGRQLAHEIYDHYSRHGIAVDAIGHSMGGLVIKAAITGVQRGESGFPPFLFVEDAVTLSTPFRGAPLGQLCSTFNGTRQCQDMDPSSSFLDWLNDNAQAAGGTDWTAIGFDDDLTVPAWSGAPNDMTTIGHRVIYTGGQILPTSTAHMELLERTSGGYDYIYCDYWNSCASAGRSAFSPVYDQFDPIKMAKYALYYLNLY
jgi:hypothetical protein